MEYNDRWFRDTLAQHGLQATENQMMLLCRYCELLLEWNKKINLISRKNEDSIWSLHFFHSASLLLKCNLPHSSRFIDLGSGGGLPGIVLKILRPDFIITLVDSIEKKCVALRDISSKLQLDVDVVRSRAEELPKSYHHRFDFGVARAVAPVADLLDWSKKLLRAGDRLHVSPSTVQTMLATPAVIAYKGGNIDDELSVARKKYKMLSYEKIDLDYHIEGFSEKKIYILRTQKQ
jgi:16S rRNA (guanine527-N7)-methyltransferase